MTVPHRIVHHRLLIVAVIVFLINAGFLLVARAQAGPAAALNDLRLFLPLVMKEAAPTPTGSLHGRLYEDSLTGSALYGATVSCGGINGVTQMDGSFTLSNVPVGSQTLAISKTGYQSYSKPVNITAGQNLDAGDSYLTPISDPANTQIGDSGDNEQILFGTPGVDHYCQYGFGGNDLQYAAGVEDSDTIFQDGGTGDDHQTAIAGDGNDSLIQYGGEGKDTMYAEGGFGEKTIFQDGGAGDDNMEIAGSRGAGRLIQLGGPGNDAMKMKGGAQDDIITINAGEGNDTINYTNTSGTDTVHIDGGPGDDTLTVNKAGESFTLVDGGGSVICQAGVGGRTITVVNVEHITVIGDDGLTICKWDAP